MQQDWTNTKIPRHIQVLLNAMYARESGFSGPEILDFFSNYIEDIEPYGSSPVPSRWMLFEKHLAQLDLETQKRVIWDLLDYQGPMKYGPPSAEDIQKIRTWLAQSGSPVCLLPSELEVLDWDRVAALWRRASERVTSDPEGAITSARALLESTCKHILDARRISYGTDGDLSKLHRAVSQELALAPEQQTEQMFRQVLSGCISVMSGLAGVRNQYGDAHGKGLHSPAPQVRHARLAVNAAGTLAMFLLESHLAQPGATSAQKTA